MPMQFNTIWNLAPHFGAQNFKRFYEISSAILSGIMWPKEMIYAFTTTLIDYLSCRSSEEQFLISLNQVITRWKC